MTVSHGHLSFYGAYVLLNLTFFYLAMPRLKGFANGDYSQPLRILVDFARHGRHEPGVWGGGRSADLSGTDPGAAVLVAQGPIRFWMSIVAAHGLMVVAGALLIVKHLLTLKPDTAKPAAVIGEVVAA